jgi:hypothetical protein
MTLLQGLPRLAMRCRSRSFSFFSSAINPSLFKFSGSTVLEALRSSGGVHPSQQPQPQPQQPAAHATPAAPANSHLVLSSRLERRCVCSARLLDSYQHRSTTPAGRACLVASRCGTDNLCRRRPPQCWESTPPSPAGSLRVPTRSPPLVRRDHAAGLHPGDLVWALYSRAGASLSCLGPDWCGGHRRGHGGKLVRFPRQASCQTGHIWHAMSVKPLFTHARTRTHTLLGHSTLRRVCIGPAPRLCSVYDGLSAPELGLTTSSSSSELMNPFTFCV